MATVKIGDTVKVHYTGKLTDGSVFDSSSGRDPLEFTVGNQQLIPGFERAIEGMDEGEKKTVQVEPEQAYGPHRPELVFEVQKEVLPDNIEPEVGQLLEYRQPEGPPVPLTVTDVSDATVTLDGNHPLAGKELTFDLELVEILA